MTAARLRFLSRARSYQQKCEEELRDRRGARGTGKFKRVGRKSELRRGGKSRENLGLIKEYRGRRSQSGSMRHLAEMAGIFRAGVVLVDESCAAGEEENGRKSHQGESSPAQA